jgi:DivIVA domain-containing protein
MPLTPDEVRAHSFSVGLSGYRKEEVRAFLLRVAGDYEQAIEAIAEAGSYVPNRRDIDEMLRTAEESAHGLRRAAAMVTLGNRSELEPLMEQAANVMDGAATLLEQAGEWAARFGAGVSAGGRVLERGDTRGGLGRTV